jgi:nickel/cobalt exporter
MTEVADLLQQGGAHAWLYLPTAVLLGALHGLEPGHSKTVMAAFIVAVRGTVGQAVLLGLSATVSHTLVVWAVALAGLYFSDQVQAENVEPWFQLASGVVILGVALWMARQAWRGTRHDHDHDHHHDHDHDHEHMDAHARAHAADISRRFGDGRRVSNGQVALFGLTGGLIPCPAAITVLLLCLQLQQVTLGATLVMGFSVGLALTLVVVGVAASLGLRHAQRRWTGFERFAKRAPYASALLIGALGLYMAVHGWSALAA